MQRLKQYMIPIWWGVFTVCILIALGGCNMTDPYSKAADVNDTATQATLTALCTPLRRESLKRLLNDEELYAVDIVCKRDNQSRQ